MNKRFSPAWSRIFVISSRVNARVGYFHDQCLQMFRGRIVDPAVLEGETKEAVQTLQLFASRPSRTHRKSRTSSIVNSFRQTNRESADSRSCLVSVRYFRIVGLPSRRASHSLQNLSVAPCKVIRCGTSPAPSSRFLSSAWSQEVRLRE